MATTSGTVTFLFTDIEGSTLASQDLGDAGDVGVRADYRRLLREACAARWADPGLAEVNRAAGIPFVRVVEALDLTPR